MVELGGGGRRAYRDVEKHLPACATFSSTVSTSDREYLDEEYGDVGAGAWPPVPRRPARKPWLAVVLSLVVPGLGHVYIGEMRRGLRLWSALLLIPIVSSWTGLMGHFWGLLAVILVWGGLYLFVLQDVAGRARALESFEPGPDQRWTVYLGVVLFAATMVSPLIRGVLVHQSFLVPSVSMLPTIVPGDHLIARKGSFAADELARGDVVIYRSVADPSVTQLSRIVGLPGEEVDLVDKAVFIDGEPLDEVPAVHHGDSRTYPDDPTLPDLARARDQAGPVRVPEGHVFLMSDNRDAAYDSRFFGPVPIVNIRARPLYVYWSRAPGAGGGALSSWGSIRSRFGVRIE